MQGDIVSAAKWLGASILLSSVVLVGGRDWVRSAGTDRAAQPVRNQPAWAETSTPQDSPITSSRDPKSDTSIRPVRGEQSDSIPVVSTPGVCTDPPGEEEIWKRIPKSDGVSPPFYETRRNNARFLIEKIGEKVDPYKVYPLAGPCQLVHCHYKCTVSYDELYWSDYPIPFNHLDHRVEVVYIDKDHLRRCVGSPDGPGPGDRGSSPRN